MNNFRSKNARPKNLNLFTIRFPLPAIISILHRVSGVILFLLTPILLFILSCSLTQEGFDEMQRILTSPFAKVLVWLCLLPFCYHFVAGIRHLVSDVGIGNSIKSARLAGVITLIVTFVLFLWVGMWIW